MSPPHGGRNYAAPTVIRHRQTTETLEIDTDWRAF